MARRKEGTNALVLTIIVLIIVVLVVAGVDWKWYSNQGTPYAFTAGQFVTISGTWATGFVNVGCVPPSGQSYCVAPAHSGQSFYLHVGTRGGMWFAVQWKQGAEAHLIDGQTVTISGTLKGIAYASIPGATFPIYYLNNLSGGFGLLRPQPSFQITDAVLI
jgi:hypothetical protein